MARGKANLNLLSRKRKTIMKTAANVARDEADYEADCEYRRFHPRAKAFPQWFDNCTIQIYKGSLGYGWTRRSNDSFEVHGDVGFATPADALADARS